MYSSKKKKRLNQAFREQCGCFIPAAVLGLNDALVELTGALAGFTMALPDNRLICLAGLTTGIAATLSMGASEFLSRQTEKDGQPYMAALYTGIAYLVTVALLLLPYFLLENRFCSLACSLATGALIIMGFTRMTSRIRGTSYLHDCVQMLCISFGVAATAFGLSWMAKCMWGLNVQ